MTNLDNFGRTAESLREENAAHWEAAVNHEFVDGLFAGSLDDEVLAGYLVQDYQFCDAFVALLGQAVASAPSLESRLRFAGVLGHFASAENDYFQLTFDELEVPEEDRAAPALASATTQFQQLMADTLGSRDYSCVLALLLVAEWLYGDWAASRPESDWPAAPKHREWIRLHNNPDYNEWVTWLRGEFNEALAASDATDTAASVFGSAVRMELEFFDAAMRRFA